MECSGKDAFEGHKCLGIHLVDAAGQKLLAVEHTSLEEIRVNLHYLERTKVSTVRRSSH